MKIAHISDLHWSNTRLEEKQRCAVQLLEKIQSAYPKLIVVAGDVFDRSIRMEDEAAGRAAHFFRALKDIAPVLMIRGNYQHDRDSLVMMPHLGGFHQLELSVEPEVYGFLEDETGGNLIATLTRMTLQQASQLTEWPYHAVFMMMPYPSSSFLAKTARMAPGEMKQAISAAITETIKLGASLPVPAGIPKILVFHGTVIGAKYSETQQELGPDIELSPFAIGECGFDLTCAGHLHWMQRIETQSGAICYPGGMSCLRSGDEPPKGVWIHDVTTWGTSPVAEMSGEERRRIVVVKSNFEAIQTIPIRAFNVDLVDEYFINPPAWAQDEMELEIRAKITEAQREELASIDWRTLFPNAKTIDVVPSVEPVVSVRCEEVRQAKTLREKILAYTKYAGMEAPDSLLNKAELIESMDVDALLVSIRNHWDN